MSEQRERYDWPEWANDADWDTDAGAPSLLHFGNVLQTWAVMQLRPNSVADAARAFNCLPSRIVEAVEDHPWLFLEGPDDDFEKLMIVLDGE